MFAIAERRFLCPSAVRGLHDRGGGPFSYDLMYSLIACGSEQSDGLRPDPTG
jgi:hypothetical protein